MKLKDLKNVALTVGAKQTSKAIRRGTLRMVFLANDCDLRILNPIDELCTQHQIVVNREHTMDELGKAANIKVKAAALGVLK